MRGFIMDTHGAGFRVPRTDRKMGVRGVPTGRLRLNHVRVPAERLGGGAAAVDAAVGGGFRATMETLNTVRPLVGARALGLAERACVPTRSTTPASAKRSGGR